MLIGRADVEEPSSLRRSVGSLTLGVLVAGMTASSGGGQTMARLEPSSVRISGLCWPLELCTVAVGELGLRLDFDQRVRTSVLDGYSLQAIQEGSVGGLSVRSLTPGDITYHYV